MYQRRIQRQRQEVHIPHERTTIPVAIRLNTATAKRALQVNWLHGNGIQEKILTKEIVNKNINVRFGVRKWVRMQWNEWHTAKRN